MHWAVLWFVRGVEFLYFNLPQLGTCLVPLWLEWWEISSTVLQAPCWGEMGKFTQIKARRREVLLLPVIWESSLEIFTKKGGEREREGRAEISLKLFFFLWIEILVLKRSICCSISIMQTREAAATKDGFVCLFLKKDHRHENIKFCSIHEYL